MYIAHERLLRLSRYINRRTPYHTIHVPDNKCAQNTVCIHDKNDNAKLTEYTHCTNDTTKLTVLKCATSGCRDAIAVAPSMRT